MITKQSVLMRALRVNGEDALFYEWQDDLRERQRQLSLKATDWADMGSPEVITVTIEPGDLLNDEPAL